MGSPWDETFEALMMKVLDLGDGAQPPAPDESLGDLGLQSLGMIRLLVSLEETYGVVFPEEALTPELFATARTLWDGLHEVIAANA